jgi:3'-phosphoadenosine 5'-phosphosulfate sulfotransferase (PAPS reductase)/FAD synthetase
MNELILYDRINHIKNTLNTNIDNTYISFSGGKDSTILHYLIDIALPNNNIPRVFINTGIEYNYIVNFVKDLQKNDDRIIIINSCINIKNMLETYGYPFKSKEHSKRLEMYQNGSSSEWVTNYLDEHKISKFKCPKVLLYQFNKNYHIKISDKCCQKLKKDVIHNYEKDNNKKCGITGMRNSEGGQRAHINCILLDKKGNLKRYHPLAKVTDDWCEWFIDKYNIKLCKLYYEPFNFKRTGCKGCPFSLDLQKQLDIMEKYLPHELSQCEKIWEVVYKDYRKHNYRLKNIKQLELF